MQGVETAEGREVGRSWEVGGSARTQRLTPLAEVGKQDEYRDASQKRKNNEV